MRLLLTSMIAGSLWSAPVGAGPDAQLVGPLTFEPATPAPIVSPGLPGPAGAPLDLRPAPAGPFDGSSGSAPCRRPAADGALYWAGVDHSAQAAEMLETAAMRGNEPPTFAKPVPAVALREDAEGLTPIARIRQDAALLIGREVAIAGECAGRKAARLSPLAGQEVTADDVWILRDTSGEIHCSGLARDESSYAPDPEWDYGKRVVVTGRVAVTAAGIPYLEVTGVHRRPGERGAFCALEVLSRVPDREGIPIRLIFYNDTPAPITLRYSGNMTHDLVVTRDGREVWRLSKATGFGMGYSEELVPPAGPGAGSRSTFIPGSPARVYVDYWDQTATDGSPVAPGTYCVQGVISPRIFTCPVRFEVPPR